MNPAAAPPVMSSRGIQREVLSDALQHPATLYPFGAAVLGAIYAGFFGPFLGGSGFGLVVAVGAGLGSAASFYLHYFVRGQEYAQTKVRALIARREATEHEELGHLEKSLADEVRLLNSPEARKALAGLTDEYARLQEELARESEAGLASSERIAVSARATYRQGLHVLADLLSLLRAAGPDEAKALEQEAAQLQQEVTALRGRGGSADRVRIKEETIASHHTRLEELAGRQLQVEELLQQVDACEAALQHARLQVPALKAEWTEEEAARAADSLLRTVESVRRVQERLSGGAEQEEGDRYLKLGQKEQSGERRKGVA